MAAMQIRFTFDDALMQSNGIQRQSVYYTLKKSFSRKGLPCISDDEVLAFEDTGRECDYGNMWSIILGLIKSEWFIRCASSCIFIEDGEAEDILAQLPELKRIMATA